MPFNNYLNAVLDLLFPPRCNVCKKPYPEAICNKCVAQIKHIDNKNVCVYCGEPRRMETKQKILLCQKCTNKKPYFDLARSATIYEGTIRKAIHNFKFKGKQALAEHLAKVMANYVEHRLPEIKYCHADLIVTVPLSKQKQVSRGYNQVDLIAEVLSRYMGIPHKQNALLRVKETKPQFGLPKHRRQKNIEGAFDVYKQEHLHGKNLLLLDDIYTTGNTVNECAKTLKQNGAIRVYALTLSRAVLS